MKRLEINQLAGRRLRKNVFTAVFTKFLKNVKRKGKGVRVSLAIVDNRIIKKLNSIYRNKKLPTDVLSFSYGGESGREGEIIISYPQAKKQAKVYRHSLEKEMQILFTHGLLHLVGFDHKTEKDKVRMHKKECEILGEGLCERN
ncbi:MAG: rRNA maturation RNase YbeY [Patescibacteria group bacterium]|nr:rRNA maturation RNase YbeY [Patescibacteria group bacterium]MDD5490246.1 rRNA maturation RNase YbeY [Patescibacteria group bacterium]